METVYKTRVKGSGRLTKEEREKLNDPNYLHKCSLCGEFKPNTEYTPDARKSGRKYLPACKSCRVQFYTNGKGREAWLSNASRQSKKNRLNKIYWTAYSNARNKQLQFEITQDDIKELWLKQKGFCFYSGEKMYDDVTNLDNTDDSVSLDKVDPRKGYVKDNIVLCRWIVNRVKQDLLIEDFLKISKQIENNLKEKE